MKLSLALLGLAVSQAVGLAIPDSTPENTDVPDVLTLTERRHGGSGCPSDSNTVRYSVANDRRSIVVHYQSLIARISGRTQPADERTNCQVNLQVAGRDNYQFSVSGATYYGAARLDPGVTGRHGSIYYFSGSPDQAFTATGISGPRRGNYHLDSAPNKRVWSPCGESYPFNINTDVRMDSDNDNATGEMSREDGADGTVRQVISLDWRRC
ncbi:secreted protein [Nannizzia gypsea CBS 118893]|uniref:Secreted protein n=1 Tax=Arthroderma gypseum (strain ATCC MYA-4604 / CBS 118893) TaxID=535722 RepID=E5R233_ARTGP|nr:secreted protein [Nannizzia gypsea CBS 118893]EFQ98597.1 secreted protein [Nannizzia gypsea CBS 118893]